MILRIVNLVGLAGVWVALWRDLSVANVLGGLAVATAVQWISHRGVRQLKGHVVVRPLALVAFGAYFMVKLVEAALGLAWEIVTPRNTDEPAIMRIPLHSTSAIVVTTVANAVTLTPGTVTVEAFTNPPEILIHVLHARNPDKVRREVLRLEFLVIRALEPDPAALTDTSDHKGTTR